MVSVRRRQLMNGEAIPSLEYPDAFMIVFDCNANTTFYVMDNLNIIRYILDGVEYKPSSGVMAVKPTTSGTHIMYFWLNAAQRFINPCNITYCRVPDNTRLHVSLFYDVPKIEQIDVLATTPPLLTSNNFSGTSKLTKIRVPKGCGDAYKAANGWKIKASIIEETKDFTYNP